MNKSILTTLLSLALAGSVAAAPISFDFQDPKGVNAIQFHLDSLLEPIAGSANGITGSVSFDPSDPGATSGTVVVATSSLKVTNDTMRDHMLGDNWLDAESHPEITFAIDGIKMAMADGNATTGTAVGKLTVKGITHEIAVPVKITHLAGAFGKRINKPEVGGDLLVVRGNFSISRSDYNIRPGQNEDKVADQIDLTLALVGSAPDA